MSARPVVHVLEDIHPAAMERLAASADILTPDMAFPSHCDAVIVRARTVTATDIAGCPNLQVIGKHGAGLDAIDTNAARDRGIAVLSTPGANAESVADLAVGLSLALLRSIHQSTLAIKAGQPLAPTLKMGWELGEVQAGIFGLGAVGRATAHRLMAGFGTAVRAFDPGISPSDWPEGIGRAGSLADLLATSQLLILHAPLLPATWNAIDASALAALPKSAYLVNCARGGIVDEAALADALRSGQIAGAASDVFAQEPPASDNPLFACPGFLATPHLGGSTNGALSRVGLSIAEQVLNHLTDTKPDALAPTLQET